MGLSSNPAEFNQTSPTPERLESAEGQLLALRYDISRLLAQELGDDWQPMLAGFIDEEAEPVVRDTSHDRTLNDDPNAKFGLWVTGGEALLGRFPALRRLYREPFRDFMQAAVNELQRDVQIPELVDVYDKPSPIAEAYSQTAQHVGDVSVHQRMDPHFDGRWTSILVVATPEADKGGRLVVANNPEARSVAAIDQDPTYIAHRIGTLVCFPIGRRLAHYTEPLLPDAGDRVIVSFSYPPQDVSSEEAAELEGYTLTSATSRV